MNAIHPDVSKLILNASNQEDDAIDGLDYMQDILARYRVVQQVLMENTRLTRAGFDDAEVRQHMRKDVISLYFKTLKYQFAMIKHFSHCKAVQVLSNMFKPVVSDDWKARLKDVQGSEARTEEHRKVCISKDGLIALAARRFSSNISFRYLRRRCMR